jgi:hypothetical protein
MGLFFAMGEYPIIDELGLGTLFTCSAFLLCSVGFQTEMAALIYGENLLGKFRGKI